MYGIITIDKNKSIKIEKPNLCPNCQKRIDPVLLKNVLDNIDNQIVVYVAFKRPICQQVFFTKYFIGISDFIFLLGTYDFSIQPCEIIGGQGVVKEFSKEIKDFSPDFVAIYNDSYNLNSLKNLY